VIVTAGPWTAALLAPQLTLPTEPTLEQVGYLVPKAERQRPAPIFICHGSESAYGLPVPGSDRYKIGIHCSGPTVSPDQQDQEPDPVMLEQLVRAADWHVPGYQPNPVETERCIYDNTPDEDFILDRVGNIVIGCGTSGHGFKFGPLFGHWLAGLATVGPEALADSDAPGARERFGVARFRPDLAPETR
jgi:sarcosine oxidase